MDTCCRAVRYSREVRLRLGVIVDLLPEPLDERWRQCTFLCSVSLLTVFAEKHAICLGVTVESPPPSQKKKCRHSVRRSMWSRLLRRFRHARVVARSSPSEPSAHQVAPAGVIAHSSQHAGVVAHSSPSELSLEIYSCSPSFFREATFVNALPVDEMGSPPVPPALSGQSSGTYRFRLQFFVGVSGLRAALVRYLGRTEILYMFVLVSDWAHRVRLETH